ncbi:hypothetical protein Poly51_00030 [Rubripirellula tenax]|uniref:Uncharacterized protein n=1 Tax=Rubripirellula tenax TaxID=2528015 RepID=A0A5C6FE24_9BACT|nr:hypothetical protein [Rubripirellula tenax]TWU59731.1 hypothetical protein Poly51_00030 [Rubripirellula tenax]
MTIPKAALELQAKLSDQWADRSWDELEETYGTPLSHIEYAILPAEDRTDVTKAYTDVKQYILDEHNVYFLRHVTGAVHLTCSHVDDYVIIDDQNRIAYESHAARSVGVATRLILALRNFLRRWDIGRDPL